MTGKQNLTTTETQRHGESGKDCQNNRNCQNWKL